MIVYSSTAGANDPTHSLLGVAAIAAELAAQGVSVDELLRGTGINPVILEDPQARITPRERLGLYRRARDLATRSDIGLAAGSRQRISDYGIYGFALVSSPTFGAALDFSLTHLRMAEPIVMQISFQVERDVAILSSQGSTSLGDMLPFCAEFWRSSLTTLYGRVLEAPFPTKRMLFNYPAPPHWRNYGRIFDCPVEFDAGVLEWHFDAAVLERPCPNANPITAKVCQQFCDRVMAEHPLESQLVRQIRSACVNGARRFPPAEQVAADLGLSVRTFHRRLSDEGVSYQGILDDVRHRIAVEFLENTHLPIDEIADRVGFADAAGFRRAFRKWTGHPPSVYRPPRSGGAGMASARRTRPSSEAPLSVVYADGGL